MMRVAIDGSFLKRPPSGIHTYVEHLAAVTQPDAVAEDVDAFMLFPADNGRARRLPPKLRIAAWDIWQSEQRAVSQSADVLHIPHLSAPLRKRLPLVVTVHDVIPWTWPEYRQSKSMRLFLRQVQRSIRNVDRVIVPSHHVASQIEERLSIDPKHVRVIPMGTEFLPAGADSTKILEEFGLQTGKFILNIAGFDLRKNLPALVRAFAMMVPHLDADWRLVIAGAPHSENTTVYPDVGPVIADAGIEDRVVLTGRIVDAAKWTLYRHAALYATPSLDEGFGLTCLEAMSAGVPVVASNRGSLPEIVGDAAWVEEPTAEEFAVAMQRLIADETLRRRFIDVGRKRAAEFTWERTLSLTFDVYRELQPG